MKNIAIFLVGSFFGALLLGAVLVIRRTAEGMKSWDRTDVYSDIQVRQAIKVSGIELPPASWDLFHAISGFQDHGVWITFTVPRDQLWSVVEASIHKKREDFTSGIPEEFLDQVEMGEDQKIDTSLWTPKSTKNPLHFSIRSVRKGSYYFEDWVVDEKGGRILLPNRKHRSEPNTYHCTQRRMALVVPLCGPRLLLRRV
jgi:hypothetical protein